MRERVSSTDTQLTSEQVYARATSILESSGVKRDTPYVSRTDFVQLRDSRGFAYSLSMGFDTNHLGDEVIRMYKLQGIREYVLFEFGNDTVEDARGEAELSGVSVTLDLFEHVLAESRKPVTA